MTHSISRRKFIKTGIGLSAASFIPGTNKIIPPEKTQNRPVVISSENGLKATEKAMKMIYEGSDPLDAVIAGVNIVENDPEDISVGYGGLPNEDGVVELDSSVMHGPTHNAGAVAGLRNIKNPSKVAKLVMERTAHVLIVGKGALRFAQSHGFKQENLLTDKSREIWLKRKEMLSDSDFWLPSASKKMDADLRAALDSHGTINCCALDAKGDMAGVTTTSGFFFKIPGRVGDSPIIGAGLYVDNDIGAAGSTGLGEANILTCGSNAVVEFMRQGHSPEEACIRALVRISEKAKLWPRYLDENGRPVFGLNFYALNKKGEFGSASLWKGSRFAVHDGKENRLSECAYLFANSQK
jgi:N4-(beta-N-acetylglucosaminyl)-L-asparaginase